MANNNFRLTIATLSLSAAGLVGIATSESYTSTAVIPVPGDKLTIGFGTTEGVKAGDKITPPVALARALADVQKYEGSIKQCVKAPLYQHEYDAYTSLAYNIGTGAFCKSTLVARLNAGDYPGACRQILAWDKFKGKPLRGLTLRREREYKTCMGDA